jgi:hypothetical protein
VFDVKRCPSEELLVNLIEDRLKESEATLLAEHANSCKRCRGLIEEYKKTMILLGSEKVDLPTSAEWERLTGNVRDGIEARGHGWPVWLKGTVGAAAAACVLVLLWQVNVGIDRSPDAVLDTAERSELSVPASDGETLTPDETAAAQVMGSVDLSGLNDDELSELDELVVDTGPRQSFELFVLDLTEEEEAELLKEIGNCSSI